MKLRRLFVIVAASVTLAACGSGTSSDGPLGETAHVSTSFLDRTTAAFGADDLTNKTSSAITLTKAVLVDAKDLKLIVAYLVPYTGDDSFGLAYWPLPRSYLAGTPDIKWTARKSIPTAVLYPSETANIVVVAEATGSGCGTMTAVKISYTQGSHHYVRTGPAGLAIGPAKDKCGQPS